MIDPSIITRGAEMAQLQQQRNMESLGELGNSLGRMVLGRRINTLQQLTTPEEKQAYANNSIYAPQLNAQIKADKATELQALMVQQKHASDIGKTDSETIKNTSTAGKDAQEMNSRRYHLGSQVFQAIAGNGLGAGKALLNRLRASNAIGQQDFDEMNAQLLGFEGQEPAKVQQAAFLQAKAMLDPKFTFTTADNVLTNQTAQRGQDISAETSRYSTKTAAETAAAKLKQDGQQFEKTITLEQAKAEYQQGKGQALQFGDSMYMVYPDGHAVPVSNPTGQAVTKTNPAIKTSIAEEQQRTQKVSVTLDAIGNLLDDATGSGIGRLVDGTARVFGVATKGDVATAKLGTLGGQLVALMPKMSGPQSDKDVEMYKQMAGKLDDPSIPVEIRKAALVTIRELNNKYSELNEARGVPYANTQAGSTQGGLSVAQSQGFQSLINKYTVD